MIRTITLAGVLLCIAASSYATDEPRPEREASQPAEVRKDASNSNDTIPPAEGRVLSPQNRSVEGLHATATPSGATRVDLEGRFQHALVLKIAPDGTRSVECIDSPEHEAELIEDAAKASELAEEDED